MKLFAFCTIILTIIVICSVVVESRRISEEKCDEYKNIVTKTVACTARGCRRRPDCTHMRAMGLIVGGVKAKAGEFPHMAAIGWKTEDGVQFKCGGSLISDRFVLTAAHCKTDDPPQFVRLGDLNLGSAEDNENVTEYKIEEFIPHPEYRGNKGLNDIALIKLSESVTFYKKNVRPACLQTNKLLETNVTAAGWGKNSTYGEYADDLMKVDFGILDTKRCVTQFRHQLKLNKSFGLDKQKKIICAGQQGKDTCEGDSGGPIMVRTPDHECMYNIVGVTSMGSAMCGKKVPAIYTRVTSYLDWIEQTVWDE